MECPTGGWWIHDEHPADDHDATLDNPPGWEEGEVCGGVPRLLVPREDERIVLP